MLPAACPPPLPPSMTNATIQQRQTFPPPPKRPRSSHRHREGRIPRDQGKHKGAQGSPLQRGVGVKTKFTGVRNNCLKTVVKGYKFKTRFQITDITCHCRNIWSTEPRKQGACTISEPRAFRLHQKQGNLPAAAIPQPLSAPGAGRGEGKSSGKTSKRTTKRSSRSQASPSPNQLPRRAKFLKTPCSPE